MRRCRRGRKVIEQQRHVLDPLPQRRHHKLDHRKPIIEVGPKTSFGARLPQIGLAGGDRAQIDRDAAVGAEPFDHAVLQRTQQFCLGRERHAVDLVEKERAAIGVLDLADTDLRGAGEGAGLMPEELALDHGLRHRRTIDGDVVGLGTAAEIVQAARDQILADAGLAIEHDACIGAGKLGNARAQRLRGLRGADDAGGQRLLADGPAQTPVLDHKLALFAGAPHHFEKTLGRERLLDEVVGAEPHRLDRGLDIAVAGDHHHREFGIELLRAAQQLHPVHALHLQVGDQNALEIGAERVERGRGALVHQRLEAGQPKPLRNRVAHRGLVVDEQDRAVIRHGSPFRRGRFRAGGVAVRPSTRRRPRGGCWHGSGRRSPGRCRRRWTVPDLDLCPAAWW